MAKSIRIIVDANAPEEGAQQWDRFVRDSWRNDAALLDNCPPTPTQAVVFEALKRASVVASAGARRGLTIFRNGVRTEAPALYPQGSDISFEAWCRRVSGRSASPVMLMASGVQAVSRELWLWAIATLKPLFRRVGLPPYGAEIGVFGGNYESTSLGIHTDAVDVFMFVVTGAKSMRVWAPGVLTQTQARKHAFDYSRLRSSSHLLTPAVGEAAYWPAGHWHIGESRGVALSLNIALGYSGGIPSAPLVGTPRQFLFMSSGRTAAPECLDVPLSLGLPGGRVSGLAPGLLEAEAALRRAVTSSRFAEIVLEEQLNRQTAMAFRPPPPKQSNQAGPGGGAQPAAVPLAWSRTGAKVVVSAAGHSCVVSNSRSVVAKLARLESGQPVRLAAGRRARHLSDDDWASVCRLLLDVGAVDKGRPRPSRSRAPRRRLST